jgi:hypothetical protein
MGPVEGVRQVTQALWIDAAEAFLVLLGLIIH